MQKKLNKLDFSALEAYFNWQELPNSRTSSHPKFSRRYIKPIRIFLYGLITYFISTQPVSSISCDVLLLHRSKKSRERGLRNATIEKLRQQGLNVIEIQTENNSTILKNRLLCPPPITTPIKFLFYASYAAFIVKQYSPKVIMSETNGSDFSPFLKAFLPVKSKLIHVAHCAITDNYRHYSLIDYDYYFLYGQSSLDKLRKRTKLFGSCNSVLTGPYIPHNLRQLKAGSRNNNILLLGVNPNMEKRAHIEKTYNVVKDWALQHRDYHLHIKLHPRSTSNFWSSIVSVNPNISLVQHGLSMQEALRNISITLGIYTNAVVDAALLNRPSLFVSDGSIKDELEIEKFFLPCSNNKEELHLHIEQMLENYSHYIEQASAFADYHLSHHQDSVDYIAQCVTDIVHDKVHFPIEHLQGTPFSQPL
jgi:hypothetical protein